MRLSTRFFSLMAALVLLCSLLPMGIMEVSVTAAQPSDEYVRPDMTIAPMETKPRIDGEIEEAWKNNATKIPFTEEALKKTGLIWTYSEDGVNYEPLPDVGGTAYVGYDANYFYFALEVNKAEHLSNASSPSMLWAGDCLQLQIGPDANLFASDTDPAGCTRYEMGFALSDFTENLLLGYKWYPEPGKSLTNGIKKDMSKADGDYYYYVGRDDANNKTVYEVALKYSFFGRSKPMAEGDIIPFSFSLHISKPDPVNDVGNDAYMEWAQGIVGGDMDKNIASAARLTLGGVSDLPIDPDPIDPNDTEYEYVTINGGDAVEIVRYKGESSTVTIPSTLGGKPVKVIGSESFSDFDTLMSVTIPNGVTTIEDGAFYNCPALINVEIPNSVTSIGEDTFSGCTSLASITIPKSVTSIGKNAFYGCSPYMIIFGKSGSAAETYALENNMIFLNNTILGDVNEDGKINTTDARVILQYAAGLIGEDDLNVEMADVTFDSKINTTDARVILQAVAFSSSLEFPTL